MLTNCFRFAPRDSVPGLIAKICKYLKDHPGWSEAELEDQIKQFIGQAGVESFNGRTGAVVLNKDDVNNLKIASAYFAEGDETIDELDLVALYNQGVRFVFTNWNSAISGYDLAFVLDYFSGSNDVVYYPMSTASGGGNIVSVNGKTGIVELSLSDILGDSGAQVKLCTATEFTSTTLATWNAYYEDGYRIVGVVNSSATAIDYIYLLKQDENNHQPIGLSTGASDAYTPTNPPPYPVTAVNGFTGNVLVTELRYGAKGSGNSAATLELVEGRTPYVQTSGAGVYEGMSFASYLDTNQDKVIHRVTTPTKGTRFIEDYNAINPPPYPVESVNGKTGAVTGFYDADNPPPYPVESVNGKTGAVTGFYDADNPPPYPVINVLSRTGQIFHGEAGFTIDESETNKNIDFKPFHTLIARTDEGTLPSGNTTQRYWIFNEKTQPTLGGLFAISLNPNLSVCVNGVGVDSQGRGYVAIASKAYAEVVLTNYHTMLFNFSNQSFTLFDVLRYIP